MKRAVLLISVLLSIVLGSHTLAQDEDNTVHIACAVEFVELANDRNIPLTEDNCISDFIVTVTDELEALNYQVIVESEVTSETDLIAYLIGATQSVVYLSVRSTAPKHMQISPILFNHLQTPLSVYTGTEIQFYVGQYDYYPNEDASDMAVALLLYDMNKCTKADTYFSRLESKIENTEDSFMFSVTQFFRGNCDIRSDNYADAAEHFENGVSYIDAAWGSVEIPTNLAWTYIQLQENDKALETVDSLVAASISQYTNRTNPEALRSRAQIRALVFDYAGAIDDMDRAIRTATTEGYRNEDLAELYTLRGEIIFLIYEWDRVLENFNTALELDPDYAPAYFQRGVLYYTMTERENALADFQHYLELAPDGEHAAEAQRYIDSIQLELESLGG